MSANQADTVNGFVSAAPWATAERTMYLDLKAYIAGVRYNRNVLSSRHAARSRTNVLTDQILALPAVPAGAQVSRHEFTAPANNTMTVISANRPVRLVLQRESGSLDMGLQSLFVISSSVVSILLENSSNDGDAEINLLVV